MTRLELSSALALLACSGCTAAEARDAGPPDGTVCGGVWVTGMGPELIPPTVPELVAVGCGFTSRTVFDVGTRWLEGTAGIDCQLALGFEGVAVRLPVRAGEGAGVA